MHFWIDKRSQGCGYSGRYHIAPSISGYGRNQRNLCSYYPKPMVTPVRRFQSIESVANNGLRNNRSARIQVQCSSPTVHYNGSSGNVRLPLVERPQENINRWDSGTVFSNFAVTTARLKCASITLFFVLVIFCLAGAKYFFKGFSVSIGVEVLFFCLLLVVVLIIGGVISICEVIGRFSSQATPIGLSTINAHQDANVNANQTSPSDAVQNTAEGPPPPYHIAVMLSPRNDSSATQIIRDSPPPSYDKAVT